MFSTDKLVILAFIIALDLVIKSNGDHVGPFLPPPAPLLLYSPKDPEYLEVLVMKVGDNLTLTCKLQAEGKPRRFVWNYLADGEARQELLEGSPAMGPSHNSTLFIQALQPKHSGLYVCTAPPYSLTKYIYVQEKMSSCPRGALQCGTFCVLATAVCDGHRDCPGGEDEGTALCHSVTPCDEPSMLPCGARCISWRACCLHEHSREHEREREPPCHQHSCCQHYTHTGAAEVEFPLLFEDRHVADDYGYIQSTIYTVTACALIFMIACVLLVSAICKMHMKRTALRSQHTRYIQAHRLPPCYSRAPLPGGGGSPAHNATTRLVAEVVEAAHDARRGARLGYTQVPTNPTEVELQNVQHTSLNNSPIRTLHRTPLDQSHAPNYCGDNTDFYFTNEETESCSRDLNYMGTFDFFRRRHLNRPLTLQLGRFQLSIPNFRRPREERRPDTPDIAEISIDDLNFVRVNANDTYTLNGRSIRLLGGNFENYPNVAHRPPTYNEAVRLKCGPPPEYLSTDVLTTPNETTSNVEMPPRYDEVRTSDSETSTPVRVVRNSVSLMAGCDGGNFSGRDPFVSQIDGNVSRIDNAVNENVASESCSSLNENVSCSDRFDNASSCNGGGQSNDNRNDVNVSHIEGNINTDSLVSEMNNVRNEESNNNAIQTDSAVNQSGGIDQYTSEREVPLTDAAVSQSSVTSSRLAGTSFENRSLNNDFTETDKCTNNNTHSFNNSCVNENNRDSNDCMNGNERFNDIIDNLPAIDSDVNANE